MTVVLQSAAPGRGDAAPPVTAGGGAPSAVPGGSEIYRVQPDGYARRIWTNPLDVVYALAFDAQGKVIAGTGNRGNIYRLDSDQTYTRLLNLAAAQVTGFAAGANGRLYAVTGNIGEIFSIGPERESSGTLESDVLDAGAFSYWGRMTSLHAGSGAVAFETRSGNVSRAQKDWSPWAKLSGDRVASPAARFLQYRATVSARGRVVRRNRRLRDEERSAGDRSAGEHARQLQVPGAGGRRSAGSARFDAAAAGPHDSRARAGRGTDTGASPALT